MNLTTNYLGLELPHPIMPGASPLVDDMDMVRRLEDAGAAAIVMHSLFEEQVTLEELAALRHLDGSGDSFPESASFFPSTRVFALGPEAYLEHLRRIRTAVRVPVIASLNGSTEGGWLRYAKLMEEAGASALELNLYSLVTDHKRSAVDVEKTQVEIVAKVAKSVKIPVSVKLSPYYSSLAHFVDRLELTGAKGCVLFNRFYQPDIEVENLVMSRRLVLSDSSELPLRLRWLAICSAFSNLSFAASGGVHSATDALKAVMCGASAVQVVSCLLRRGPEHIASIVAEMRRWLDEHEYVSLEQARGSMNHARCPDPAAYERANYVNLLMSWHGVPPG